MVILARVRRAAYIQTCLEHQAYPKRAGQSLQCYEEFSGSKEMAPIGIAADSRLCSWWAGQRDLLRVRLRKGRVLRA